MSFNPISMDEATARFTPAVIDESLCMARTWSDGKGGQCLKARVEGFEYCKSHKNGNRIHGRVDGTIPPEKLGEFIKFAQKPQKAKSNAEAQAADETRVPKKRYRHATAAASSAVLANLNADPAPQSGFVMRDHAFICVSHRNRGPHEDEDVKADLVYFDKVEITFGQDLSNDVVLRKSIGFSHTISGFHARCCRVEKEGQLFQWILYDNSVRGSTLVNGERVDHLGKSLVAGDIIVFGQEVDPPLFEYVFHQPITALACLHSQELLGEQVLLNIGGVRFVACAATLRQSEFFNALLQDERERISDAGALFIDRDGQLFHYVLRYLQLGAGSLIDIKDLSPARQFQLATEAQYYSLPELTEYVRRFMTYTISLPCERKQEPVRRKRRGIPSGIASVDTPWIRVLLLYYLRESDQWIFIVQATSAKTPFECRNCRMCDIRTNSFAKATYQSSTSTWVDLRNLTPLDEEQFNFILGSQQLLGFQ